MFWWLQNWKETIALQTLITDHCKGFNLGLLNNSNPWDQEIKSFWWSKLHRNYVKVRFFGHNFLFSLAETKSNNIFVIYKQFPFQRVQTIRGFDHFLQKFLDFFGFWHTSFSKGNKKFCPALGRGKFSFLGSI